MISAKTIAADFAYPEGPRWHENQLWFADQHDEIVHILSSDGSRKDDFKVPGGPSGMGWMPDGDLLVVSMEEHKLLRRNAGQLTLHADFADHHQYATNEMVVDTKGRAYVGNIGFDFEKGEKPTPTQLLMVAANGSITIAATDLLCPNGTVITADGKTLIIAESLAHQLTAFDIAPDGQLSNRRIFADLPGHVPDGICLDAEGQVWAASPFTNSVIRVREGGEITQTVAIENAGAYACILGGEDGRDLYVCCANPGMRPETLQKRGGRIDVARVEVPASSDARP